MKGDQPGRALWVRPPRPVHGRRHQPVEDGPDWSEGRRRWGPVGLVQMLVHRRCTAGTKTPDGGGQGRAGSGSQEGPGTSMFSDKQQLTYALRPTRALAHCRASDPQAQVRGADAPRRSSGAHATGCLVSAAILRLEDSHGRVEQALRRQVDGQGVPPSTSPQAQTGPRKTDRRGFERRAPSLSSPPGGRRLSRVSSWGVLPGPAGGAFRRAGIQVGRATHRVAQDRADVSRFPAVRGHMISRLWSIPK